ncbi:karyopherin alpha, partial [Reticulomyxa filosa]
KKKKKKKKKGGVLELILETLNALTDKMKRIAMWTLRNFCYGKPSPDWEIVSKMLRPLIALIQKTNDEELLIETLWTVCVLSEDRDDGTLGKLEKSNICDNNHVDNDHNRRPSSFQIDAIVEAGMVPLVVQLLDQAIRSGGKASDRINEV